MQDTKTESPPPLPDELPVFPLSGVLLLPRGHLPLNIFEPRYVAMVDDALKSGNRMIGMIQPRSDSSLYETGCAGRITNLEETKDGRYLIALTGICRFRIAQELPQQNGYRRVRPDWSPFVRDSEEMSCLDLDRPALREMLSRYFAMQDIHCDMDAIDGASDEKLITCLSMVCPFDPGEKQVLLEAKCCRERAQKFMALLKMAVHADDGCCGGGCH